MKTKRLFLSVTVALASVTNFAQVVGDASLGTYNFTSNSLPQGGNTSQYQPLVFCEDGERSVIWTQGTSGDVGVFHTALNSNYISNNVIDTVVSYTGILNSDGDGLSLRADYNANAGKFGVVYRFADNITTVQKDFSLKAKSFSSSDFSASELVLEGPFDYSNELPFAWEIAAGPNNTFGVVYMSDGGNSTNSVIRFKTFDANTGIVSPAASAGSQTGTSISAYGAKDPSIAWNEQEQVWGITYVWGTGNNTKIVYVALDASGSILTPDKDLVSDNSYTSQDPTIKADGDGFALVWRDFRSFQIPGQTSTSGMPATRICQLSKTGDVISNTGTSPYFDNNDNSLILANPYSYGTYIYHDFAVVADRETYGVTWITQDAPYAVYFTEAQVSSAGEMNAMIPVQLDDVTLTSNQASVAYESGKYIVCHMQHNSQKYKNRIAVGEYEASNTNTVEEVFSDFQVFPNPSNGVINFSALQERITVFSTEGKVIGTYININQLDLTDLSDGIYILQSGNGATSQISIIK